MEKAASAGGGSALRRERVLRGPWPGARTASRDGHADALLRDAPRWTGGPVRAVIRWRAQPRRV